MGLAARPALLRGTYHHRRLTMCKRLVFASLADDKIAYVWYYNATDSPFWYPRRGNPLHDCAGYFETYGDGLCQHSGESAVQAHNALDYVASLAAYLMEHRTDGTLGEIVGVLQQYWPTELHIGRQRMLFAMNLKANGKRAWFSLSDQKVSAAASKQYDKRWTEVESWMDGTLESAYRLLNGDRDDKLWLYMLADELAALWREEHGQYCCHRGVCELCGIVEADANGYNNKFNDIANQFSAAFDLVTRIVKAVKTLDDVQSSWNCLENNYVHNMLHRGVETEIEEALA